MQPHFIQSMSLFFLFIAIIFIPNPTSVNAQDMRYQNCRSTIFMCGKITDIGYPFWGSNRPEYCGPPQFKLNCTGETAVINIKDLSYQVLEINSESKSLKVARTDYINRICPSNLVSTTLDFTYYSYPSDVRNVTLYYGCPTPSNSSPSSINQFFCNGNGNYYVTRNLGNSNATLENYFGTCTNEVIVSATQSAVEGLERQPSPENLVSALEQGFGLEWRENSACETCELSGGQCGSNFNDPNVFACYCTNGPNRSRCAGSQSSGNTRLKLGLGLGTAAAGALTICLGVYYCFTRRPSHLSDQVVTLRLKDMEEDGKIEKFIINYQSLMPKRYSYSDIEKMTNSFIHKLGQGGFGGVYKGKLRDGRIVAVKVLSNSTGNGEEFINEVASISRTSHINIVTLLGFCYERTKRALIYEYMPSGSLDKYIYDQGSQHNNKHLEWKTLYDIAVGTARGLEYLHRGCNTRIVHFDIKPHNILLDEDFCPKIADFGLAKLCKGKESLISMLGARGTVGYIAPEVFMRHFGGVSYKSDVYSYGMMMLEMFGGRNNIDVGVSHTSEMYFPDSIYKYLESTEIFTLHENITDEEEETVRRVIIVGMWCIQTNPSDRPSMTKVVEMLEGSFQSLQIPPKPSLLSTTTLPESSSTLSSTPSCFSEKDEEKVLSLAEN